MSDKKKIIDKEGRFAETYTKPASPPPLVTKENNKESDKDDK